VRAVPPASDRSPIHAHHPFRGIVAVFAAAPLPGGGCLQVPGFSARRGVI